ncbi:MAG TPA: hypothetical protein VFC04_00830 [Actinomycetota bacterium]|nr:hypothetical protein [Actinomycetota bacterium]
MDVGGHESRGILRSVEAAGDVQVERALVGMVNGRDVSIGRSACGPVMARGSVTITQGGCGPVMVGENAAFHQAGCGPVVAKGDVSFEQGGCQSVIAGGGVTVGPSAFVGLALSPRVSVEEGGRVLLGVPQAIAFGAACGVVCALVRRALGRR